MLSPFFKITTLFLVLLLIISKSSKAEVGCATGAGPFTNVYGVHKGGIDYGGTSITYIATAPLPSFCGSFLQPGIIITGNLGSCTYNNTPGYLATYETWCPLDDYIPYLMLGIGGLGFLFIRKRNLAL